MFITPLEVQIVVGGVAAGSLALSVYNFFHAKGEPVRARQRVLQSELGAALHPAQECLEKVISNIDATTDTSVALTKARSEISRVKNSLKVPTSSELETTAESLGNVITVWQNLIEDKARAKDPGDHARLNNGRQHLKAQAEVALVRVSDNLKVLAALDKGETSNS